MLWSKIWKIFICSSQMYSVSPINASLSIDLIGFIVESSCDYTFLPLFLS